MEFGAAWGTDEISSATPMDYYTNDIFVREDDIKKAIEWPVSKYPDPAMEKVATAPEGPPRAGGFANYVEGFADAKLTDNTLVIMLLVILVVLCTVMYNSIRQTQETIKLMLAIIVASRKAP